MGLGFVVRDPYVPLQDENITYLIAAFLFVLPVTVYAFRLLLRLTQSQNPVAEQRYTKLMAGLYAAFAIIGIMALFAIAIQKQGQACPSCLQGTAESRNDFRVSVELNKRQEPKMGLL
jgi:hypothetical protein